MRKNFILFVFGLISLNSFSQSKLPIPKIWLRADNQGTVSNKWQDVSGNNYHAFTKNNQAKPDTGLFNFHNCFVFDSVSNPLKINYLAKKDAKLLILAVYKPENKLQENGIWAMGLDSTIQVKLSTQRLKNVYKFIKYNDSTSTIPTINSLSQNWKNKHIDSTMSYLVVGGSDSLNFTGKFAEFILFDTTLKTNEIWKMHTYLAIKYGISLRNMNYITSNDSVLWNYKNQLTYKYDIAGIGRDSLLGIYQKQSTGNGGESPLKIAAGMIYETNQANPTYIEQGDFILWGNNGENLSEINEDTSNILFVNNMSKCVWFVKNSGVTSNSISTQVVFNASQIQESERIALVINREGDIQFPIQSSELYLPDSMDADNNYYFNSVFWDTDLSTNDVFGFQIIKRANRMHHNNNSSNNQTSDNNEIEAAILSSSLFPNPADHEYELSLILSKVMSVQISIQDPSGKVIEKIQKSGSNQYSLSGYLKDTGCYLITIQADTQTKTYKLIVR